ncbi:retention module-containing protein [Parasulfuritortus cantonensis]|uniref:Retention module-containing protein n=1 Tax=Parasulfuritortus cantonensis TaxID=2528202 RepID=A0A4R1BGG8_9PROT|nr:retention module-containing protein [Parasulfuritortus cantonensis]TCJ16325.1 retention module-containing protein [Parasulfuritortus cantonensis]
MAIHSPSHIQATVTALRGEAYVRDEGGKLHKLHLGDTVRDGEIVVTAAGAQVELAYPDGNTLILEPGVHQIIAGLFADTDNAGNNLAIGTTDLGQNASSADLDSLIQAIEQGKPIDDLLEKTAAGLTGGETQEGHTFVRLDRIVESVTGESYAGLTADAGANVTDLRGNLIEPLAENQAPTANDDNVTLLEDTVLTGNVLDNDTDPDGDNLAVTGFSVGGDSYLPGDSVTLTGIGTFTLAADGRYTFSPAKDYDGPVPTFTYFVSDGHGGTDSANLNIQMIGGDDTPVAGDDHATTNEDTAVTIAVLANDSDVDGDPLTIVKIAGTSVQPGDSVSVSHGIATLNADGTITFTPEANYFGDTSFTYTISDGTTPVPATVYVTVNPVNDAPNAVDDVASTPINTAVDIDVKANDSDPDNTRDQLTVSNPVLADPSQGTVSVNPDGSLLFTPASNVSGPVLITYTLSDPDGLSDTATVTVTVGDNTPPDGTDVTRTTDEDTPYVVQSGDFGFSDPDAGQAFYAVRIDTLPDHGTLFLDGQAVVAGQVISADDIAAGKLSYLPDTNENGTPYASFTFSVQDSAGAYDDVPNTFTFDVNPVNDAPNAVANHYTTPEDTVLSGNVITDDDNGSAAGGQDSDVDNSLSELRITQVNGEDLVFNSGTATVALAHGTLVISENGDFSFTPAADYNGTQSFTYTVSDPGGLTDSATVNLTVDSVNDPPVAKDDAITLDEDVTSTFDPLANDVDPDTPHDQLAITSLNGQAVDPDHPEAYAPSAVYDPVSGQFAGTVSLTADGQVKFDPADDYNNDASHLLVIPYTVSDGQGGSDSADITLEVRPVNDAPTANDDNVTLLEDTVLTGNVLDNDTDPDGDSLAVTGFSVGSDSYLPGDTVTLTGIGTFTLAADGRYTFSPAKDYDGPVPTFTYFVSDGHGGTDSANLNIQMIGGDDTPVAGDDHATTNEDTAVTIAVLANDSDVDGDPLTIVKIAGTSVQPGDSVSVSHGIATLNADGTITFTPEANYFGDTSFTYTISDGTTPVPATVYVTVNPVNDAPNAVDDVASTPINTAVDIDVKANDSDPDNTRDQLTVSNPVLADPSQGTVSVNPDGSLLFTPASNVSGPVLITYTLSDPDGLSDTATVTVTVGDNTPPDGTDVTRTTDEDTPYVVQSGDFGFSDPDAGQAFYAVRIDTLPDHGTLFLDGQAVVAGQVISADDIAAGKLSYLPDTNENGTPYASFTFSVQDSAGAYDNVPNTFTFDVNPVNDAPDAVANHYTTPEDTVLSGNVITDDDNGAAAGGQDSDVDNSLSELRITQVNGQYLIFDFSTGTATVPLDHGTLVINENGDFSFTPAADYNGTQSFTYTVSDPGGLTDSATVNLTVDSVNDPPVAKDDAITLDEDVTSTFDPLANDVDPDTPHDQLAITSLNGQAVDPDHPEAYAPSAVYDPVSGQFAGTVSLTADGQVKFDPADDYNNDASHLLVIPYTVSDGQGGYDSADITLEVRAVNDAPVAHDDSADIDEDASQPATGNVLANDTDADGDNLDVLSFQHGGTVDTSGTLQGTYGTLTWDADTGAYAYALDNSDRRVQALGEGQTLTESFAYTMTDGTVDDSATLTVTIHGTDDGVTFTGLGASDGDFTVSESALANGSAPDAAALVKSGSFTLEALDGIDTVTIAGTELTVAQLTNSATYPISLDTDYGTLVLTGYSGDGQGGSLSYQYTLTHPVDNDSQAGADGDHYVDQIAVSVSDVDGDSAASSLNVNILDDSPSAQPISVDAGVQPINTNLLIVLDTSGSMGDPSGMTNLTRMEAAVAGIYELLEQYDSMGDVMVNIAYFYDTAYVQNYGNQGGVWLTVDQAKAFLANLGAGGWTNYDAALAAAMDAYDNPGKLADAQNVAYFLSDGYPNYNNSNLATLGVTPYGDGLNSDDGIQDAERATWVQFLKDNDINAFSIGMGTGVSKTALDPVGYNGLAETEQPAIEVHDMNDFSSVLASTVKYTSTGNLLAGGTLGADGGRVGSLSYQGEVFSFDGNAVTASAGAATAWQFDAATNRLTLTTDAGTLTVDMDDGDYVYTHNDPDVLLAEFLYTITDNDGDSASSSLTFNFAYADPAPLVRDDAVYVAMDYYSNHQVTIQDAWLLWNDSDKNGDPITVTSVNGALHNAGAVTAPVSMIGTGAFSYTGTTYVDSTQSDTGQVTIVADYELDAKGDGLDNILIGGDGIDTIRAYEGNDVLVGNGGNDRLYGGGDRDWLIGGAGDDKLEGGAGNDLLEGGLGSDTFTWRLADPGSAGSPAEDVVTDFGKADGDVLNLADLLQGETHGADDYGNLDQYLDVTTDGAGNTVIRVSSTGGFTGGTYDAAAEDQRIVLQNVDLYDQYGVSHGQDAELIKVMLKQGGLVTD